MVDQILQEIERNGYSFQEEIVSQEELKAINCFFDERRADFRPALIGASDNKQRVESVRGDFTHWIDPLKPEAPFTKLIEFLGGIKERINEKFYLGLKQYETHLAYYPPGTFYKKHLDRHESNSTRTLSFVFYLNQEWSEENGGELVIYSKENEILKVITPKAGSFVCFLSDEFPHEVKSAKIERRSMTGWMHTRLLY